ncbi:MAG: phosphoribosyltransferase family protein [Patescibacteria group bacterium]|jgi:ComF family protein
MVPSAYGKTCNDCNKKSSVSGIFVRGWYDAWLWRPLIRAWKYQPALQLSKLLGYFFEEIFTLLPPILVDPVIVPVPLSRRRRRARGFNQAEDLAKFLAAYFHSSVFSVLQRTRHTKPQAGLGAKARLRNVRGVFVYTGTESITGRDCILVDDIVTTGATVEEAARVLIASGAASVWVAALARSYAGLRKAQ